MGYVRRTTGFNKPHPWLAFWLVQRLTDPFGCTPHQSATSHPPSSSCQATSLLVFMLGAVFCLMASLGQWEPHKQHKHRLEFRDLMR